ncbi:MAG: ankyrin repeat domain-containing protein [Alphaproteobacteria bacterium]|nr:ankyrin repeat domain-containing protein [Alphaproteobacteria bacterium]
MDVDQPNAFRKTPLMTAAQFGLEGSARWLIGNGAHVNAVTEDTEMHNNGRTALHYAAASGSLPLIRLLVEHGASIDARDTVGGEAEYLGVKDTPGSQTPLDYLSGAGPVDAPKLSEKDKAEAVRLLTVKR